MNFNRYYLFGAMLSVFIAASCTNSSKDNYKKQADAQKKEEADSEYVAKNDDKNHFKPEKTLLSKPLEEIKSVFPAPEPIVSEFDPVAPVDELLDPIGAAVPPDFLLPPLAVTFPDEGPVDDDDFLNKPSDEVPEGPMDWLVHWNHVAIDASGEDHIPSANQISVMGAGEQLGPTKASRAIAMVQIAVFEAINAIEGGYKSYLGVSMVDVNTSIRAAIAQAAHDTLNALFPSQSAVCDNHLAEDLSKIPDGLPKERGIELGHFTASKILNLRSDDNSDIPEPLLGVGFFPSLEPGKWRQDPISHHPKAIGAFWGDVTPFVLESADQFRVPTPPDISSPEYAIAFDEVKRLGGDGIITPTERTDEETEIGIFWAYDGTPSLCAPPRLYNQLIFEVSRQMGASFIETARLYALTNVAMADAAIAIWESKYYYQFWRPVTGIRESDPGTGPTLEGDGNDETIGDVTFTPLGAPASNLTGPNFTPPFPSYPSGHAGFGGAIFQMMRNFFGRDDIRFTFVSDEFNGKTIDNSGHVRPLKPRSFNTLSEAEEENGQSRIYLGIHWSFDKTKGIEQGRNIADYVFENIFTPLN